MFDTYLATQRVIVFPWTRAEIVKQWSHGYVLSTNDPHSLVVRVVTLKLGASSESHVKQPRSAKVNIFPIPILTCCILKLGEKSLEKKR